MVIVPCALVAGSIAAGASALLSWSPGTCLGSGRVISTCPVGNSVSQCAFLVFRSRTLFLSQIRSEQGVLRTPEMARQRGAHRWKTASGDISLLHAKSVEAAAHNLNAGIVERQIRSTPVAAGTNPVSLPHARSENTWRFAEDAGEFA